MVNNEFCQEYGKYVLESFEFECGMSLDNAVVEYNFLGCPKYDDDGNICNAVVFTHRFNDNCSSINNFDDIIKEGGPLDKNEYFIISITSLGYPESCSPSTTDLKYNFPQYTFKDRVNFKKQFLKECLSIEKIHGIFSIGLGGYEALTWACEYPQDMDFIIVLGSSSSTNGYKYVLSKCVDSLIESNDSFYSDVYDESMSTLMISILQLIYLNYFSKNIFKNLTNDEIDVLMEDFIDKGLFIDIYDFKFKNDAVLNYNIKDKLNNIEAKSLIMNPKGESFYSSKLDATPLANSIPNSKLVLFDSKRDYSDIEDYTIVEDDLFEFLDEFKK